MEQRTKLLGNMRLEKDKAILCLRMLLEGNSIRSVERLTGVHRDTVVSLVVYVGQRCQRFMEAAIQDVPVEEVQADEIWGYVGCKNKTKERCGYGEEFGDAFCYTAIERHTKLLLAWHLGKRTPNNTHVFAQKLQKATAGRFQLTTDGYRPYRLAMWAALRTRIDFAQLLKIFNSTSGRQTEARYSPGAIVGTKVYPVSGAPDESKVCTSHAERHNLTIRTQVRRMTRLTNAFSKKWENHEAALGLFFAFYNFCRVHGTLKTTPAVAAGLTGHTWSVQELLETMAATQN
ncbi:MAG: hypothetical protein JW809_18095 [Pirellulales bacterium]|nr:hypothetical protein [Pirellulales bacterium]